MEIVYIKEENLIYQSIYQKNDKRRKKVSFGKRRIMKFLLRA